ncbi:sigma-70 family RNA polymerase sigma factor, partial [Gleimia hominis]|nr:sigma-70 family RNA polymerase sigma factor [Gleimia hominis]
MYVPSAKGWARIKVLDLPEPDEAFKEDSPNAYAASVERAKKLREQILDPDYQADWKIAWAQDAYKRFR